MIRAILAVALVAASITVAEARQARRPNLAPIPVPGAMVDDRYPHLRLPEAYGTARARKPARHSRRHYRKTYAQKRPLVRVTAAHPVVAQPSPEQRAGWAPLSLPHGFVREVARALPSGRPAGCPARAWCGCWLGHHLGMARRDLWLARNWARVGRPAGGPQVGAIVVWSHHVGKITAVGPGGRIRVVSGNDGRAVRDRWRTTRGVIAYRFAGG